MGAEGCGRPSVGASLCAEGGCVEAWIVRGLRIYVKPPHIRSRSLIFIRGFLWVHNLMWMEEMSSLWEANSWVDCA
jgi:hypothetical protein